MICRLLINAIDSDRTVKAGWHRLPAVVFAMLIVDVNNVYVIKLSPFHSPSIHIRDSVGRKVGYFNTQRVAFLLEN
jgi:hypothetical protein